jgi:sulfoxide reductase heme-binding subunit YedZ
VCATAVVWLFWRAAAGALGPDPVKVIEKQLGEWAIWTLAAGLAVTPLRRFTGIGLIGFRRALGVSAFALVTAHLATWVVLDMGMLLAQALADTVKRPFVTAGMAGFLVMIPLAATSNNWAVRRLGPVRWRKLHRLTYLAAFAGAIHVLWQAKVLSFEPVLQAGAILTLLAMRLIPKRFPGFGADSRMNRA